MTRRSVLLALAAACVLPLLAAPPRAWGGDDAGDKEENAKKKRTPEWKTLEAVGAEVQAKDAEALVARMRKKGKIHLGLGPERDGEFAREQATTVLGAWFEDKRELSLELKSMKDLLGEFKLTFRKDGSDKLIERRLGITLEKREKTEGFVLTRIEFL